MQCPQNQPLFMPPHAPSQLQVLDLSIFGVTKRLIQGVNRLEAVKVQSRYILEVI
jgi:hypothetical protein